MTVNWGFTENGADSETDRITKLRHGFSYFSGFSSTLTPGQLGFDNRRRLVVLQGVDGGLDSSGAVLPQWRVLYTESLSSGDFTSGDDTAFRAAINSVFPAPAAQDYNAWKIEQNIPTALSGPFQDADGDGDENIKEFYFSTTPTDANSRSKPEFAPAPASGYTYTFNRAQKITGVTMRLLVSTNLSSWDEVTLTESNTSVLDMTTHDKVTISLPAGVGEKFYRIELTESTG